MSSFQGSGRKSANVIAYSCVSTETAKCFNCDWLRLLPFTSTLSLFPSYRVVGGGWSGHRNFEAPTKERWVGNTLSLSFVGYMYVGHKCSHTVKLLRAVLVGMASRNNPTTHHATPLKPVQKKKKLQNHMLYHDINMSYCTWHWSNG